MLTPDQSSTDTPVNGTSSLSPAQQRQLEADKTPETSTESSSKRHSRKSSNPPNILSEGDFPTLGNVKSPVRPVTSWGAKRPVAPAPAPAPAPVPTPALNGVNGKAGSSNSSRASTPAPTPRAPALPGSKNLHRSVVIEHLRMTRDQLQNPNAKDFAVVCDKVKKSTGVDNIAVARNMAGNPTFSIAGKPENVAKAKIRIQSEVGIKVVLLIHG
jgi:hypothetical protein